MTELAYAPGRPGGGADRRTKTGATAASPVAGVLRSRVWQTRWTVALALADGFLLSTALVVAVVVRFGVEPSDGETGGLSYAAVALFIAAGWALSLGIAGAYETRHLGTGAEEYKRIAVGTFQLWAVVAIGCYAAKMQVARGFVVVALPLGLLLLLAGRTAARRVLVSARQRGLSLHRVIVIGDRRAVVSLAAELRREKAAGFEVIGACMPEPGDRFRETDELAVLGTLDEIPAIVREHDADTVAVASAVAPEIVRRLSWGLEGSGVDLVVAPSVVDVAGPRVSIRPVAGLPLLHVDEPEFTGGKRVTKTVLDRMLAAVALVLLAPVLIPVAILIRVTSPGPALFRQTRIGRDGHEFKVFKFRTMYVDAEARLAELAESNETDGLLFKIAGDPRITRIGRFLRRTSIDELPQLLNVVLGDMSLVGPRPLPVKDSDFTGDVRRRLLVRPGITGLWQVNGRSELSWEDAVRLDLYYVENWSIALDLSILGRTVGAVVRGTGAY
ncbi:MAG TPA: sugar transferase [Mycobacteriales bacterium]|nr:sugar transferase [Mycobacteriales bacterium]